VLGVNSEGELGTTTSSNPSLTPVDVNGLSSGVSAISSGYEHTCALTTDGWVKCWGFNYYGQLGDGTTTNRFSPVGALGLSTSN